MHWSYVCVGLEKNSSCDNTSVNLFCFLFFYLLLLPNLKFFCFFSYLCTCLRALLRVGMVLRDKICSDNKLVISTLYACVMDQLDIHFEHR